MKIWEKGIKANERILQFTIGNDQELDLKIADSDIVASVAHTKMLQKVGLISNQESADLINALKDIFKIVLEGKFSIEPDVEDIHSQLEKMLIEKLGDTGKKIHTARSRNDQVITALKLFYRKESAEIAGMIKNLVLVLVEKSEKTKDILMPGYTHLQAAMYSSFGLWFSSWAEAFTEDLFVLEGAFSYINQNPLGSAAGYGSSFPIDRHLTTQLLKFDSLHVNSINAQLSRGKTEKILMAALAVIAGDIAKMSMDLVLFLNQNFGFIKLSDDLTTGSSIMPHKKNPDVVELLRAKANRIQSRESEVITLVNNLPSGYQRDFQLLKEICFPVIDELKECLEILTFLVPEIIALDNIVNKDIYKYLGSVDAINKEVIKGTPFRTAYRIVADKIQNNSYEPSEKFNYTHTGSIGNLALDEIKGKLDAVLGRIDFEYYSDFNKIFIEECKVEL